MVDYSVNPSIDPPRLVDYTLKSGGREGTRKKIARNERDVIPARRDWHADRKFTALSSQERHRIDVYRRPRVGAQALGVARGREEPLQRRRVRGEQFDLLPM